MEWTCCGLVSALLDRVVVSLRPLRRSRSLREVCAEEEREEHRCVCAVALSAVALSGACCSSQQQSAQDVGFQKPQRGSPTLFYCRKLWVEYTIWGSPRDILGSLEMIESRPSLYGSGRGRVSIARSRGPLLVHPAALCPPHHRTKQIEGTGGTRGPRRPKRLVVVTQCHRGHPAAAGRGVEPQTNLRVLP